MSAVVTEGRICCRVRVYPDARQQAILRQHIGASRFIYNCGLRWADWNYHEAIERGEKPKSPSHFTFCAWLTEFKKNPEVAWLNETPTCVLRMSLERLARAYQNFFKGRERGVGFPKIKGKHGRKTARYSRMVKVSECGRFVHIPPSDFGWMQMRGWRPEFTEQLRQNTTVELAPSGRWYLVLMASSELPPVAETTERICAVHCGMVDYVTVFDGSTVRKVENPKLLESALENQRRKARKLSRKAEAAKHQPPDQRGYSKRREAARIQLARCHERVRDARQDHYRKVALEIVRSADVVILETWGIADMLQEKVFSRAMADCAWSSLLTFVEQKSRALGKRVVRLEKAFPSSLTCNACGHVLTKLSLSQKTWKCPMCACIHDRNENAARNVYAAGLAAL